MMKNIELFMVKLRIKENHIILSHSGFISVLLMTGFMSKIFDDYIIIVMIEFICKINNFIDYISFNSNSYLN
ncbi:hypothetical protein DK846_03710 [Methanospirillum lacunae]|uniref:Uncharacterized protein n=1 Tax=Methanospirillum lacunae TaxID=668570 RepID=A0A2V2NG21_9EURY|nr:hypothetical protein DK846_03710 [Methanospirillum lacunae]